MKGQFAHIFFACFSSLVMSGVALSQVPMIHTAGLDMAQVRQQDSLRAVADELPLYGRLLPVMEDMQSTGTWDVIDSDRRWRLWLSSENAKAVELFFDEVDVPEGATLSVFDREGTLANGPHAASEMDLPSGLFTTAQVPGDRCLVEYREPLDAAFRGVLRITDLGHDYLGVQDSNCEVDAACLPEGEGWQDAVAATVRISVVLPGGTGWCSGTLVNNVRQDCTPYILSAWHCGAGSTSSQYGLFKFYFGYQHSTCGSGVGPTNKVLTGAQLRAYSNDAGGTTGSDFMLLEASQPIPSNFYPYWSGWDATVSSTSTADGVCVHHPMALPKKISTYTQTLTSGHWNLNIQSHWLVQWAATTHGHGVTESGSSGSGLFRRDESGMPHIIGTLSGGSASCDNTSATSYFGKMSYHWTGNPNTGTQKLKFWLDPDNTGVLVLDGTTDPCGEFQSIAENDMQKAMAWPVPADGELTVDWGISAPQGSAYTLSDVYGRTVFSTAAYAGTSTARFDVSALCAGTYIARLSGPGPTFRTLPVIIAH